MKCNIDYKENNKWIVYIHIVPKLLSGYDWDKYYVGITCQNPKTRWKKNGKGYETQIFYKAIQKYGWNNIQHEIIAEHLTKDEAKSFEQILIKKLKSNKRQYGYNITEGGDSGPGTNHYGIAVAKYDLNGNFNKAYLNMSIAENECKIPRNNIRNACLGIVRRASNFQWRFINDFNNVPQKIEPYKKWKRPSKRIIQYDEYGNFVRIWENINEICNVLRLNKNTLYTHLNKRKAIYAGYQWRYEGEEPPTVTLKNTYKSFRIYYKYSKDGKYIDKYLGFKQIKEKYNINKGQFDICLRDILDNYCNGFRWTNKYYDYLPPLKECAILRKSGDGCTEEEKIKLGLLKYYYMYDIKGNFIDRFTNVTEKFKELKCDKSPTILYHKFKDITNNFYYGYRWTNQYYEKLPPLSEKGLKQVKEYERKRRENL